MDKTNDNKQLDLRRVLLIELAHLLSSLFMDSRYWEGVKTQKDTFSKLLKNLTLLGEKAGTGRGVLIQYRGSPSETIEFQRNDYVIFFDGLILDLTGAASAVNRLGIQMSHLGGRLSKAFGIFSSHAINTLYLKLPGSSQEELKQLQIVLSIISSFKEAVKTDAPVTFINNGRQISLEKVRDQLGRPDPNLTATAALNDMSAENMQTLVGKVDKFLKRSGKSAGNEVYKSVYSVLFDIKPYKDKLIRPLIEINNEKWSLPLSSIFDQPGADADLIDLQLEKNRDQSLKDNKERRNPNEPELPDSAKEADPAVPDSWFEEFLAENPKEFQKDRQKIIKTAYGNDYNMLDSTEFVNRLTVAGNLLGSLENSEKGTKILDAVIRNLQEKISQVSGEVFNELTIQKGQVKVKPPNKPEFIKKIHSTLLKFVWLFKERVETREKIEIIAERGLDFGLYNNAELAARYDIPEEDARGIIELLQTCFNENGHFLRNVFESRIDQFIRYEKKVFEFLWSFLKETLHRNDRIAFLNCLQLIIAKNKQPKRALKFLLSDVCRDTAVIYHSDRNAFMLVNLLLRTYNQELDIDIELTPEEVLQVKNGMNKDLVKYVQWRVDFDHQRFFNKVGTVHQRLVEALKFGSSTVHSMPVHFLVSLEREIYIFLSLVGGKTARNVIRSAIMVYGNPQFGIYHLTESDRHLKALLQQFKIVLRGLGRVGQVRDFRLLNDIQAKIEGFAKLDFSLDHQRQVERLQQLVEITRKSIAEAETGRK